MSEVKILSPGLIQEPAREFLKIMNNRRVVAFYGELGSGKTTFIKALCRELGVADTVSSPTFALVYEYRTLQDKRIYHFDLYRIKNVSELFDLGYEEYFHGDEVCFIEWPEIAEILLPPDCIRVYISVNQDGSRNLKIEK
jgi:tRNA threonylcarbamoyladenosine biosynthesis protein TsaE